MIRLMIRTVLSLTVVALGGTSILFAGQTGRQFSLSGSVVNAVTAAPVPYASVALSNGSSTETDATGAFQFSGLEANVYGVMATKAGFVPAGLPGKEVPEDGLEISLTASVANIVVKLIPLGAIRGRVVDGAGEPVQNATVTALRSTVVYGRRQLQMVNLVQTNDLGDYRISGLLAGKYLVQRRELHPTTRIMAKSRRLKALPMPLRLRISVAHIAPMRRNSFRFRQARRLAQTSRSNWKRNMSSAGASPITARIQKPRCCFRAGTATAGWRRSRWSTPRGGSRFTVCEMVCTACWPIRTTGGSNSCSTSARSKSPGTMWRTWC